MNAPRGLRPFCSRCGANLLSPAGPRVVSHRYRLDYLLAAFTLGLLAALGFGLIAR